jgi:3-hydroxybutyrate dehydrogenase
MSVAEVHAVPFPVSVPVCVCLHQVVEKVLLADQPTKQFVKPEDLAAMVVHLCGPNSASITGACISIDGGWTAR